MTTPENNEKDCIRSFIAIDISEEAKKELTRVQGILKKSGADVKWAEPASVHMTLKFLGNIPVKSISAISERLKNLASVTPKFSITLHELGVFPKWDLAKVLWVGVDKGENALKMLAGKVEEEMLLQGFDKETRVFKSHITIGRFRSSKHIHDLKKEAEQIVVNPALTTVASIVLYRSTLTGQGSVYDKLFSCELLSQ
ncbi:MAG TPA: RNA 2',3'-cyclic phosphodiesterase [Candidatus Omnitrophota bacterium]|nr:RNA 2',3'-cyclic phosphodiesterase [Candidatus Omnitrophota bacterium]